MIKISAFLVVCLATSTCASAIPSVRGLNNFILNTLNLQSIWDQIIDLDLGNFTWRLLAICAQLVLSGQQGLQQVQAILAQLISDFYNQIDNANSLVIQAIASLTQLLSVTGISYAPRFNESINLFINERGFLGSLQELLEL